MQQRGDNSYFLGETYQAARKTGVRLAELAASAQEKITFDLNKRESKFDLT
jgi:hypothetical protein